MTVAKVDTVNLYTCASGDSKPTAVPPGSLARETDTHDVYILLANGTTWVIYKGYGGVLWP